MVNLNLAAVYGEDVCSGMVLLLDHFGEGWFAAEERFPQKSGGSGGGSKFLQSQVKNKTIYSINHLVI